MLNLTYPPQAVALVTGSSRGIGRECALRLAAAGIAVAINYRTSAQEAESLVQSIRSTGGQAASFQADMADIGQASRLVEEVEETLGTLSILVNNAGITRDRLLLQMSPDDWDATWCTDLAGPRAAARRAIMGMVERGGGRVVNISSVVGTTGNAGQANYAAAKSALNGLTRELALLAAPAGVTVNCVIPGYITTDATAHLTAEQQEVWMQRIPMRRAAVAQEVVAAILFLVSSEAAYVTGQCLAVDGGLQALAGFGFQS